jgi:prevent-host-death family protein
MTDRLGVAEAKRRFSELIDRVAHGERVVVTRHGKPAVAIVPPDALDARLPAGRPTGFAALAGVLADVEDFGGLMEDVVSSRRTARDRAAPQLD